MKLKLSFSLICFTIFYFNICIGQTSRFIDTSHFKIDTVIAKANISGKYFSIKVFRNNDIDNPGGNDSNELIFFIKENKTGKEAYFKEFKENQYNIFKLKSDSINKNGRLFLELEFDGGGSGFSGQCYELTVTGNAIKFNPVYNLDELTLLYFISDNEIIKLEGIWNFKEDESHFANHRYDIFKYTYVKTKFVQLKLGKTRFKYASLDELKSPKQVLLKIKKREPLLLKSINLK